MRIAALVSGTGTILQALIAEDLPIVLVVVDRACPAESIAKAAGIEVVQLVRTDFSSSFDRDRYSDDLVAVLQSYDIDLVVMAGFGTIIGRSIHEKFHDRILNTHPALLPAFKGWHAVRDAIAAGVKVTGCTVHLATDEVDEGTILAQQAVPVLPDDTEESLHERIKEVERRIYPTAIRRVIEQLKNGEQLS